MIITTLMNLKSYCNSACASSKLIGKHGIEGNKCLQSFTDFLCIPSKKIIFHKKIISITISLIDINLLLANLELANLQGSYQVDYGQQTNRATTWHLDRRQNGY